MGAFEELNSAWQTKKRGRDGELPRTLVYAVSAQDLTAELARLAIATDDPQFLTALEAVLRHELVDGRGE